METTSFGAAVGMPVSRFYRIGDKASTLAPVPKYL